MKAIIPVAGAGTKLRPHTYTQPKALIPLAGKTVLGIIIDQLRDAGIEDFVFIIGYLGEKIQDYVKTAYPQLKCSFVVQNERQGLGHAILLSKEMVGEDEVVIVLGDTIADVDLKQLMQSAHTTLCVKKVDDPRMFGVAELNTDGTIKRVVEKPAIPKSNLALVGIYRIKETKQLLDAIAYNIEHKITTQNEYHLTDALMKMISDGVVMRTMDVDNWFDCGKKEILLDTNATLLARLNYDTAQYAFENTIIIPPVFIGQNCRISNSIIGPNVSVGDYAILNYSIAKDSIIGPYAQLEFAILERSLLGNDALYKGMKQSLNIGDSTEINFG